MQFFYRFSPPMYALRQIRARIIVLGAIMLSSALVGFALVNRWNGGNNWCGSEYYIPLRDLRKGSCLRLC